VVKEKKGGATREDLDQTSGKGEEGGKTIRSQSCIRGVRSEKGRKTLPNFNLGMNLEREGVRRDEKDRCCV